MSAFEISDRDIQAARARIAPYIAESPLVRATGFEPALRAWLKLETQQPTASFKVRPAFNSMLARLEDCRAHGALASSSGNFAQAVAFAARTLGVEATIVMPSNTSAYKIERTRALGGRVELSGPSFEERWELTERLRRESKRVFLHPYDSTETIAADATIGLELLERLAGDVTVVVPCSGGGMLAGVACTVKQARPRARVIGVQPAANSSMVRSFKAGARSKSPPFTTIGDALVAAIPGERTFELIQRYVDDVVAVSEDEMREAVRRLALEQKLVVEPGGAAAVAAALFGKVGPGGGELACIVSGGNVDPRLLAELVGASSP